MQRGDNRTPEGEYVLGGRNAGSRFYKSIHISYPNEADRISARERGVNPGGSIMIHGVPPDLTDLGADHRLWDWTNGCIAVTNGEMDEIWTLVDSGTPIEIRPCARRVSTDPPGLLRKPSPHGASVTTARPPSLPPHPT